MFSPVGSGTVCNTAITHFVFSLRGLVLCFLFPSVAERSVYEESRKAARGDTTGGRGKGGALRRRGKQATIRFVFAGIS